MKKNGRKIVIIQRDLLFAGALSEIQDVIKFTLPFRSKFQIESIDQANSFLQAADGTLRNPNTTFFIEQDLDLLFDLVSHTITSNGASFAYPISNSLIVPGGSSQIKFENLICNPSEISLGVFSSWVGITPVGGGTLTYSLVICVSQSYKH